VYDVHYWRSFGTQQCFRALLKAKSFDTALQFIEGAKKDYLDEWWDLALEEIVEIPVYATDGKCKVGEKRYASNDLDRLMNALLKGRDLSEHPPGRRGVMEGVVTQLASLQEYPACIDNKSVIGWLNKFIDLGLESEFWWEGEQLVGGLASLSGMMRLGDVDLANRILSGGIKQERKNWVYLYARAPNMEMVKLLEKYFKLKKSEYKQVLQVIDAEKKRSEYSRKYGAGMATPESIAYFKRHAQ